MTQAVEFRSLWGLRNVIEGLICDAFRMSDLRRNPSKSLRVHFRFPDKYADDGNLIAYGGGVMLWLWAPMNYVGVFAGAGTYEEPFAALGYHDSCWRESVERFISEHLERLDGLGLHGMEIVHLSELQQEAFRELIRRRNDQ